MRLCGLVSAQVMCQSDNQILRQCFRREEVIDQKRPEMVRHPLPIVIKLFGVVFKQKCLSGF